MRGSQPVGHEAYSTLWLELGEVSQAVVEPSPGRPEIALEGLDAWSVEWLRARLDAELPDGSTVSFRSQEFDSEIEDLLVWCRHEFADDPSDVLVVSNDLSSQVVLTADPSLFDAYSLSIALAAETGSDHDVIEQFTGWHREHLASQDAASGRAFWSGAPEGGRSSRVDRRDLEWAMVGDEELWRRVEDRSVQGVGLQATALACWLIAISCMEGIDQPVAISQSNGRFNRVVDRVVGPLAAPVPIWADVAPEWNFADVVDQVELCLRKADQFASDHDPRAQATPGPTGYGYRGPIVSPDNDPSIVRLIEPLPSEVWLDLQDRPTVWARGDGARSALRVAEILKHVLEKFLAFPDEVVPSAALLPEVDAAVRWSEWKVSRPQDEPTLLGQLVAAAMETPDAVAIRAGGEHRTYRDVLRGAGAASARLRQLGVGPGAVVPVVGAPTIDTPAILLGIMGCGAAYAPIDDENSPVRLAAMLEQVLEPGIPVVSDKGIEVGSGAQSIHPGELVVPTADASDPSIQVHENGSLPAYVICTSGSSGSPNAVVISQAAAGSYVDWSSRLYGGQGPALLFTSLGFDLTVTSLWTPFASGDGVVLPETAGGVAGLAAELRRPQQLGIVKLTPTHLRIVFALTAQSIGAEVGCLVVGGEEFTDDLAVQCAEVFPKTKVFNEYGPTEATVGATTSLVSSQTPGDPVLIGKPAGDCSVAVLDPTGWPLPCGAVGELYLGGRSVATGYRARPRLTAERFVPDPREIGSRMYRTSDLVVEHVGGLRFLGRSDDQIKIRGVRVEPGEVEAAIRAHPAIRDANVQLVDIAGRSGGGVLAAYVVPAEGVPEPSAVALSRHCRSRLPDALVPAAFVVLPELPRTVNGKVDAAALPPAVASGDDRTSPVGRPSSLQESILAEVMADVLGLVEVGVDDDYFGLGGDSIRSVMIVAAAEARGVHIDVASLHANPTIRSCLAASMLAAGHRRPPVGPFDLVPDIDRARMSPELDDAFPLNLLQEGMIFHRSFAARSAVYHAIASVVIRAPLDPALLSIVVDGLLRRHPMLRTSFDLTSFSIPLQLVHSEYDLPLEIVDVSNLDEAAAEEAVVTWVEAEKQRGFDLELHPLIRFVAHDLGRGRWRFTYGFHHEIVDGWSEALMVTELFDHYFSLLFDEPISLAEPESTMREAVALEIEAIEDQSNYDFWDAYLEDVTLMRLPRFGMRPTADDGARDIVRSTVDIDKELSDGLKLVARELAIPLKHVLLAAHMAVMRIYGGHLDTLTYTVTQGRPEGTDGTTAIGLFVNSLALRLQVEAMSWEDLIRRTLASETESLPHRRLPMAELKRHLGHEPLAETLFFFTDYHIFHELDRWKARDVAGVDTELYGESTFPFCAIFRTNRESGDIETRLEWDKLQFDSSLMDDIGQCYEMVLAAIVREPQERIDLRPYLPRLDRELKMSGYADSADSGTEESVLSMVQRQASRTPDAIAVHGPDGTVSYRALLRRSAAIADSLQSRGIGATERIALLLDRGTDAIAAMLGIWMRGGSYVTLSNDSPGARTVEEFERAGASLVLTNSAPPEEVQSLPIVPLSEIELGAPVTATSGESPARPAYVMLTSGSTGRPKAVVVSHGSLAASTGARLEFYRECPVERFLHLSPLHFDSSVAGLYWTLAVGGELDLVDGETLIDPSALRSQAESASHLLAVPALYAELLGARATGPLTRLSCAVSAGESLQEYVVDLHRSEAPNAILVNEYGPTEATVWSTGYRVPLELPVAAGVPIGRPIDGVRTTVTDGFGHPTAMGVMGELAIGGLTLADGYVGDPRGTAEAFVPDERSGGGSRLYRTGDVARFLETGDLEFHGRSDDQVKIRGFRVELSGIERVLEAHTGVERAAVTAPNAPDGERRLEAYVTASSSSPDEDDIISFLQSRLPKHMIPSRIIVLDALPLTATGKLAKDELPVMAQPVSVQLAAPETPTEEVLCQLMAELLGADVVGATDNFFDLGGESLLAMKIVNRLNRLFETSLSVRAFFGLQTVREIAATVDEQVAAFGQSVAAGERGTIG